MKNYEVKALYDFNDLDEGKRRLKDEVFKCTEARYNVLLKHNAVELLDIINQDDTPKRVKKSKRLDEVEKDENTEEL